jgi:dihydroorotase
VSAEVTPHHLLLTEELASGYDPLYKVNPPLRTSTDVQALREGLIDGTVDIIATDHAPHPKESKDTDWASAAFGMVGLETAYSVAQSVLIDSGKSNFDRLSEVMSSNAATISGLDHQGRYLAPGLPANLTLVDPQRSWTPEPQTLSMSENNPFIGIQMRGRVRHTIYNGEFSYRDYSIMQKAGD